MASLAEVRTVPCDIRARQTGTLRSRARLPLDAEQL